MIPLLTGVIIALFLYFINPFQVAPDAARVLAVAGLMITWWIGEALPMPVVALIPLVFFPLLKISSMEQAASPYANPVIFLFMGGFMIGLAIEKWNLHRRIALNIIRLTGTSGDRIILGFIFSTGLLSMWLSNTATTMMMFPIALSVIQVMRENDRGEGNIANFSLVIMLVIAYASNIGGIATIIGTPPNVAYVAYIEKKYNYTVDFLNWMLICAPLAIILLLSMYWIMVKWMFPNRIKSDHATKQLIRDEIAELGPFSVNEKRVLTIFLFTAGLWIFKDLLNSIQDVFRLNDSMIAITGALALFICPASVTENKYASILEWEDTSKMAWGILLLFGGGISLATALENAGLMQQLGEWLSQFAGNQFLLLVVVVTVTMFMSEVMSNVAQVIVFAPVVSSMSDAIGMNPLMLGIAMTLAASCASMLPMGTPPNAIVFASGHIRLSHMVKAGFVINVISIILISLFCWFLLPMLLNIG
jgi:anion transporter